MAVQTSKTPSLRLLDKLFCIMAKQAFVSPTPDIHLVNLGTGSLRTLGTPATPLVNSAVDSIERADSMPILGPLRSQDRARIKPCKEIVKWIPVTD